MDKLITFAVPCYNSAAYMEHCVETLLQGGDDIEIILVDDGSTKDDTPAICDRYRSSTPTSSGPSISPTAAMVRVSTRAFATPGASTTRWWTPTTG